MTRGGLLIVVDLQRGFINEHTRHLPALVEAALPEFQAVIATRYYRREDSLIHRLLSIDGFAKGSPETELAFEPPPGTTVVEKSVYSCVDDEFANRLRRDGAATVHVCGVDTDQCVLMTAADLLQHDVKPIVLANLSASAAGPAYHDSGLRILRRLIGDEQVVDYPLRRHKSRRPFFDSILRKSERRA